MRISLPLCIASALAVLLLSWWLCTRSRDFMEAPTAAELQRIRVAAAQAIPAPQGMRNALSGKPEDQSTPIPVILPESLKKAPRLDDYLEEARHGADYLIEMASLLEAGGHPERALACWERVLDSCITSPDQARRAASSILKLKRGDALNDVTHPTPVEILIHCGSGPTAAQLLEPILMELSKHLERASLGVLEVGVKISAGTDDLIDNGQSPAALWISGTADDAPSTDVASIIVPVEPGLALSKPVELEIYRTIRRHLNQMDDFQPLPKISGQYSPDKLLESQITRMVWMEFAKSLQKQP